MSGRAGTIRSQAACSGPNTIIEHIREARNDPSVRAIVLRIDSPGGSATASDAIWRELVITREERRDRPLVVSMSDLAASGGYWIAMAAPYIVAQPGTLTGSIGVGHRQDGDRRHLQEARRQHRDRQQGQARRAGLARAAVQRRGAQEGPELIQDIYDQFIEKASASRHMKPEKLDAIAQGRVWTGRQAKANGLVDELGGLDAPSRRPSSARRSRPTSDVEVVVYPPKRSLFELLSKGFKTEGSVLADVLPADERRAVGMALAPFRLFRPNEALALMPSLFLR